MTRLFSVTANLQPKEIPITKKLKPKEWHEQFLANTDKKKIGEFLKDGQEKDITRIAVTLARQCGFFLEFARLWTLRVSDFDARLGSEHYMQRVYVGRRTLYKSLNQEDAQQ